MLTVKLRRTDTGKICLLDITAPDIPIGVFTDALSDKAQKDIIITHNAGLEMLALFENYYSGGSIPDSSRWGLEEVLDLLNRMGAVYDRCCFERFTNARKTIRAESKNAAQEKPFRKAPKKKQKVHICVPFPTKEKKK